MTLLETIIDNNLPWRIIGKKRQPNIELQRQMNSAYDQVIKWDKSDYQTNLRNPYIESFENKIELFEQRYWDMTFYKQQIDWYKMEVRK